MQNIFLIGMPSSGKSTLGRELAASLGYTFVDLDIRIAEDQEMTIPELFEKFGEGYFREVERRLLLGLPPDSGLLVATGGGAPCFFDNMDFIKKAGLSIFLDVPAAELAGRIRAHARDDRPLLSGVSDLEADLEARLNARRAFYERADLTIHAGTDIASLLQLLRNSLKHSR